MRTGIIKGVVFATAFYGVSATAGESGIQSIAPSYRPVIALLGGYAGMSAGASATYVGDDDDLFVYRNSGNGQNTGFIGAFLGAEHPLPWYNLFMQLGVEYNYFWPTTVNGINTVGIEPDTSTLYRYNYRFQTQQVLASAKFLTTTYKIYHPYFAVGIGAAFNEMSRFAAVTQETGSINLAARYGDHTQSQFTYNLGVGVDADVYQNIRVGLGYRFSGFGNASMSGGQVVINNVMNPVPFALGVRNAYANQFLAQITYVV